MTLDAPNADHASTSKAAHHWANVAARAYDKVAQPIAEAKREHVASLLEEIERDLVPHVAPFLADLAQNPDIPQNTRDLFGAIVDPEHFAQSFLIGLALGAVLNPVIGAALQPEVQAIENTAWAGHPTSPLTPALLAEAVIKGVMTEADGATSARESGISQPRFHTMTQTAGNAIGIQEALLLFRRGDIDEAELERIVRYSNVRIDFLPDIKKLQFAPPSAGEVIAGFVKGRLTEADAKTKLAHAGINPSEFGWLWQTAGRPYGIQQALQLWNRGVITRDRVIEVIRHSDVNPSFTDDILNLRVYLPPPRSVVPMLRNGAITEARARTLLEHHGLSTEDANAFITEAHHTRSQTTRELSAAQIVRAYEERILTQAVAHARLVALRFPAADADLMLEIADNARLVRFREMAIARVHSAYVSHKIDRTVANADLAKLSLPVASIADLLAIWTDERNANIAVVSETHVAGAYRRGIITLAQFIARIQQLGFSGLDVKMMAANAWPPGKVPQAVYDLNPANL